MIKLQINIGSCSSKVLVDLIREQQLNVISFLKRVVQICGLDDLQPQQLQLYDGQFLLPHLLPSRCILQDRVYTIMVDRKSKKDAMLLKRKQKQNKAKHKQIKQSNIESSQSQSKSLSSSSSIDKSQKIKRGKYQKRQIQLKQNIKQKSIANSKTIKPTYSNQKVIRRQQQKQQSSEQSTLRKNKKLETKQKQKQQAEDQNIFQSSESSSPVIAVSKKKKGEKIQQKCQSLQSQQSSSPLPQLPKKEAVNKNQTNDIKKPIVNNKPKATPAANISKKQNLTKNRKQSSSEQPSQSAQQIKDQSSEQQAPRPSFYAAKVKQILSNVNATSRAYNNNKDTLDKSQNPSIKLVDKPKNIPISVRNKISKPVQNTSAQSKPIQKPTAQIAKPIISFKEHQQQKWVPITKQILKQWESKNTGIFVQQKNQIRFKIVQLDQQKFVPVSSGWIVGYFTKKQSNDGNNSMIYLDNVTKNSRDESGSPQYIKNYEIPIHNLQQLQINKNTLNDKQKEILKFDNKQAQNFIPNNPVSIHKPKATEKSVQKQKPAEQKKQQSIQQYICGQIHYYFTDKNYNTDLFMQMHANKDAEKYIPIKLMLNFPKIKKVLTNEGKLWQYLTTDNLYGIRSYELDYVRKMIRKKQ